MCAPSCPNFCDPMDCSLPGSSVHDFSRQEYWNGLPFLTPGELPDPGSPALQADSLPTQPSEKLHNKHWGACIFFNYLFYFWLHLGLCCCTWAFSSHVELGLLLSCSVQACHCSGFSCCRARALGCTGLSSCGSQALECGVSRCAQVSCLRHVGSS